MKFLHLGPYSDLVEATRSSGRRPAPSNDIQRCLDFSPWEAEPRDVRVERSWSRDGIAGEEISWSCGYGPRTFAWLYRDENVSQARPGVLLLHDHGAFKFWGKEKMADGPDGAPPGLVENCRSCYGDRVVATELVRAGFTVLVHDAFLWGSRKVPYETMPASDRQVGRLIYEDQCRSEGDAWSRLPEEVRVYNAAAYGHEHTMNKYATLLGGSLAGIVAFEDQVAAAYLRSRSDLCNGWIACAGLSGGGLRSALLRATCPVIRAAVIVGMMSTYEGLLDRHLILHTWMLYPPALARQFDWPEVVAHDPQVPVLVQFDSDDPLFSPAGMHDADAALRAAFTKAGKPDNYQSRFYPGPHKFDVAMQEDAIEWLRHHAARRDAASKA